MNEGYAHFDIILLGREIVKLKSWFAILEYIPKRLSWTSSLLLLGLPTLCVA
jgi:hypothetical protein